MAAIAFIGIGSYKAYTETTAANDMLFMDNVEALCDSAESSTTYQCDGKNKNACGFRCGNCGTAIQGTGALSGSHSCSTVIAPKSPYKNC